MHGDGRDKLGPPQSDADLERQIEDGRVVDNMQRFGGGFVQALAAAWVRADLDNRRRIKTAFPELWERYSKPRGWDKVEG